MAKKKNTNGVWKMELDRFGYTLVVLGQTKGECDAAMREEYIKAYAQWNELNEDALRAALISPVLNEDGTVDGYAPDNEFRSYYESAFEDAEPRFYEFGKVEWE